jgi:5-methylcytosine-specific restriction endonuclease McrA
MSDPFNHDPRKRFTAQERAAVFAANNGRCHICTRKLGPNDKWTLEHVIALENGGTNDTENLSVSCSWCEPEKTAADHEKAGKSRRNYTRHAVHSDFRRSKSWGYRP